MSDIIELWKSAADGFAERVAAIGADDWTKPTCCDGWDVRALVDHAIGAQRMVPKALGASGAIDTNDPDLQETWLAVRAAAHTALSAPGALAQTVTLPFGDMPAEQGLSFPLGDVLLHSWDLARALGGDIRLNSQACELVLGALTPLDAGIRGPGIFGPKLEAAADADVQDQLLAFVGRQV